MPLIGQFHSYQVKTVEEAIKSPNSALSGMRAHYGETKTVASLILVIDQFAKFFNVGKPMNSQQISECAFNIMYEFYFLKLEDLNLFFTRFKTGYYGQLYDRLDGAIIMFKLREYVNERIEVAERLSLEKHKEILETERGEDYLVRIGNAWLRSNGDDFEEVEHKEMATAYTYGVAYRLAGWIKREQYSNTPDVVKITPKNAAGSLFDYMAKNTPQLLPQSEKYKRSTSEYFEAKKKIMDDSNLTPFQKHNAIRALSGLSPESKEDYNRFNQNQTI